MKNLQRLDTGFEAPFSVAVRFDSMGDNDTDFMKRALELASRGAGLVSPNPMVGAVLVKDDRIIGEGFHRYDRLNHAEYYALEMAGDAARGSTLYCNLEPCCHHGRTPPCADSLIEAGIRRAFIAAIDPDSRVSGRGIEQMRSAGIEVEIGLRKEEAARLNEIYLKYANNGQPFVYAIIKDEGIGLGDRSDWMPSNNLLKAASEFDAIAVGDCPEINRAVIEACLRRERHRRLAIAGNSDALESLRRAYGADGIILTPYLSASKEIGSADSDASTDGNASTDDDASTDTVYSIPLEFDAGDLTLLFAHAVNRLKIRSILLLPGALGISASSLMSQSDKVTFVARKAIGNEADESNSFFEAFSLDFDNVVARESSDFSEVTGYPRIVEAKAK
jgi:pyrimidine deaminase RibD-like protein